MNIPDAWVTAGAIAGDVTDDKAREIIEAALAAVDPEWRTEIILEAKAPPDNGTVEEVLLEVLRCANAWVPEARIIGNARAGDIARVVSDVLIPMLAAKTGQDEWKPMPRGGVETDWQAASILQYRKYRKLAKAAAKVIEEADRIHDNELWPMVNSVLMASLIRRRLPAPWSKPCGSRQR